VRTKRIAGNGKHCLKLKLGHLLTLTGFCRRGRPSFFRLGVLLLLGDYRIRKLVLYQNFLVGWLFWEVLGSLWLKASAIWWGGSLRLKTSVIGEAGRAPFELYPGICLTTEEKHGKPQSEQPSSQRTTRYAELAVF
jgi:hypothetical protein